jgi:hypothetical protein
MFTQQYDTWEATDDALFSLNLIITMMCDIKPNEKTSKPAEIKLWNARMREVRKWGVQIHERRIQLNVKRRVD